LRVLLQNVGVDESLCIPEQILTVDSSTRRRGEEMFEITYDDRLVKKVLRADGSPLPCIESNPSASDATTSRVGDLCKLQLYESVVLIAFVHAIGCPTTFKFRQKAKFMKLLIRVNESTIPIVIPFSGAERRV